MSDNKFLNSKDLKSDELYMPKIVAIGNAIVDILFEVDDDFLKKNSLVKGSMQLAKLAMPFNYKKISCGGSAANTLSIASLLGAKAYFIGKVGDDEFGKIFIEQSNKDNLIFYNCDYHKTNIQGTASCNILITPDSQRTMLTDLGCASQIYEEDIKKEFFENKDIFYIEGYMWDSINAKSSIKKGIKLAKENNVEISFTLSDSFCVARHKEEFKDLIINDVDLIFANEDEIRSLLSLNNEDVEELNILKLLNIEKTNKIIVVTRGERGCLIYHKDKIVKCEARKVCAIDSTGAGDAFAAAFIYAYLKKMNLNEAGQYANKIAAKMVEIIGARFEIIDRSFFE